tara:strand:- start:100 stop:306 length:207 start_codon:yes stop_codon:yes gene_type:complete
MIEERYAELINSLMVQKEKLEKQVLKLKEENFSLREDLANVAISRKMKKDYDYYLTFPNENQLNLFDD